MSEESKLSNNNRKFLVFWGWAFVAGPAFFFWLAASSSPILLNFPFTVELLVGDDVDPKQYGLRPVEAALYGLMILGFTLLIFLYYSREAVVSEKSTSPLRAFLGGGAPVWLVNFLFYWLPMFALVFFFLRVVDEGGVAPAIDSVDGRVACIQGWEMLTSDRIKPYALWRSDDTCASRHIFCLNGKCTRADFWPFWGPAIGLWLVLVAFFQWARVQLAICRFSAPDRNEKSRFFSMCQRVSSISPLLRKKLPEKLKWGIDWPACGFGMVVAVCLLLYAAIKPTMDGECCIVWPEQRECTTPYVSKAGAGAARENFCG